jgi:hypothetical protein
MRILTTLTILALLTISQAYAQNIKPSPYIEAGIPAVTREWSGADYAQTFRVLSAGSVTLPRFSDRNGAMLLGRITSTDNFSFYQNRSLPIQSRLQDYLTLHKSVNSLAKLYFANPVSDMTSSSLEISSLLAFLLRTSAVGLNLVDEFIPTIPKDNKYANRMNGLKTLKSGLTTVFAGAEVSLTEKNGFSSKDRSHLLEAMAATLPTLKRAFAPDYRLELQQKLRTDREKFINPNDALLIDAMVRELD